MSRFIDSTDWTSAVQWARTRIDLTRFFLLSFSNDNRVELAHGAYPRTWLSATTVIHLACANDSIAAG